MTSSAQLPELPEGGLSGLFDGTVPPGVYRTASVGPDVILQAQAEDWYAAVVDLDGVTDRAGFLARCADGLELDGPLDGDWDALADRLTDLSWLGEPRGYLILASGWPEFQYAAPQEADSAAGVMGAAAGYWAVRESPLAALLG
ncbi:barstar family protein [Streptomyces sp. DSM 42041]|uniref:Barstar family protein n=1 Tax=Streptomyces hazeniae TaxID=3075538 RepID=A0ABU2NXN4_9ACTN|nr:barstar family protein [Streptomyces sp. DSM 42041]MDT0381751.1 barstar family protein [Streptomyces sp. DSM 42041]